MKKLLLAVLFVSGAIGSARCAETMEQQAQKMVKSVQEGCKTELTTFCKDVTPGEGRQLACLYAFEDKLSNQCEYALYDAASKLERATMKLKRVAADCSGDIDKYCSDVQPGQGHILNCLNKNQKSITPTCSQALKDTGLNK
jgi:hypothetical protein